MVTDRPTSWLLGAGYSWRTAKGENVADDRAEGLSLARIREQPKPPQSLSPVTPTYCFGRLGFDISRERREVRAYDSEGHLRHCWESRDRAGVYVPSTDPLAWDPADMAGDHDCVFLLDQRYQIVYTHRYGRESLVPFVESDEPGSRWARIALDEHGCLLIFDPRNKDARCYGRGGKWLGMTPAPWPALVVSAPAREATDLVPATQSIYQTKGYWLSKPIDSKVYDCQWHRIEMTLSAFPPGTQIEVKAYAYKDKIQAPVHATDPRLVPIYSVVAPIQPPQEKDRQKPRIDEFLIQTEPGQYLSLLISLHSDGWSSPIVQGVRVHYPRQSYLEYLPPLFSASKPMRSFLEAFLSCIQTEWDEFDRRVDESEAFFVRDAVPEGAAMKYLAGWIGLQLEGEWKGKQNRRLLQAVPKIYPRRGTPAALRDYVGVYLANFAGLDPAEIARTGYPAIVEGFRERQSLLLSQADGGTLGQAQPLWSDSVVKRLHLGGFAKEGDVELVSTGDPEHDFFNYFAHRFRIYVPAIWVRTAEKERMLRRAIEAEMPAHVAYELCLVEAGVCVGSQSTVGLDTIVGEPEPWRLPSRMDEQAPSLPPLNRLATGTVLSRQPGPRPAVLDSTARVGDWTLN